MARKRTKPVQWPEQGESLPPQLFAEPSILVDDMDIADLEHAANSKSQHRQYGRNICGNGDGSDELDIAVKTDFECRCRGHRDGDKHYTFTKDTPDQDTPSDIIQLRRILHDLNGGQRVVLFFEDGGIYIRTNFDRGYNPDVINHIFHVVEQTFYVSREHMQSGCRKREYVNGRKLFAFLMRMFTPLGTVSIGHIIGVDHATITHYVSSTKGKIFDHMLSEPEFRNTVHQAYQMVKLKYPQVYYPVFPFRYPVAIQKLFK